MPAYYYVQQTGGEESWFPIPASRRAAFEREKKPTFITVLSVSKMVEDLSYEDKLDLHYIGPMYFDWDSKEEIVIIDKVNTFLDKLENLGVDLSMCSLFATGGKGYHLEIPPQVFMDKVPPKGVKGLPGIYKEVALELFVDTLDLRIYSAQRGRMWRTVNKQRENGRYKVAITATEMRNMTPETCRELTSAPRTDIVIAKPEYAMDLAIVFEKAAQKVEALLKKRKAFKPDPKAKEKAGAESIQWMMAGLGIKPGAGFHEIAIQLSIAATTAGLSEEAFVIECAGLINNHQSDSVRYNTPEKRAEELARMHRYMDGNFCYEFSIGAVKSLLTHSAPDLDGLPVTKQEVLDEINAAAEEEHIDVDEYADVARGISLSKYGIYQDTVDGKKRICAVSFANSAVLRSASSCQIIGYETDVLVNGQTTGRQTLETEVFTGLTAFNRFAAKYGHSFQGLDPQVRTVMMRFVEQAKKKGTERYVVTREGLDIVSIPNHEDPRYHKPFFVWADGFNVVLQPDIKEAGLEVTFAGYPDPRGVFKTDLSKAPALADWIEGRGNRDLLRETLLNLFHCQKPDFLGKVIGWHVACFWKQLFHKTYDKFPILHINGAAGLGKTETVLNIGNLFYSEKEVRPLSPGSTPFAMIQHLCASASIPMVLDEYKPHAMKADMHEKLKGMIRDAYNQRDVARGGGSRESDDYRVLHESQMSGPMVFIAEAAEDEAAVMERVVLATITRPSAAVGLQWLARFQAYHRNRHLLGILGQYMAATIVNEETLEGFEEEFDALYTKARDKYMLNAEDLKGGVDPEKLKEKQNAKERSVYNHTVAMFGFLRFRKLVKATVGDALESVMDDLQDGIFARMSDLHAATTPEYIKVLTTFSSMSYEVDALNPMAQGKDYEYVPGTNHIEIALRAAYFKYRVHCKGAGLTPLYANEISFMHAVKDSSAFVKQGSGALLQMPGIYTFDADELARLGVDVFRSKQ